MFYSIQLYQFEDGFGLFENKFDKRLSDEEFCNLVIFLKNTFPYSYKKELYPHQKGYLYHTDKTSLESAIASFLGKYRMVA